MRVRHGMAAAVFGALAALGACGGQAPEPVGSERDVVAIYTSLPLIWPESEAIRDQLSSRLQPHWSLAVFERYGRVEALDALVDDTGGSTIPGGATLVLAQPRALTPQENVALDDWVRSGGEVLLLVDPMLTADSTFALGDPRRPQDIAMLSPILARWGLQLRFDDTQPWGEHEVPLFDGKVSVNLRGSFALTQGARGCVLLSGALVADCRIGKGRVVAFADAAMLEDRDEGGGRRLSETALTALLDRLARKR